MTRRSPRRRELRVTWLYVRALVREFRWTLVLLALALGVGAGLHAATPLPSLGGRRPSFATSLYATWMMLLGEQVLELPDVWYLLLLDAFYPLVGLALVAEGMIRFGLLMFSRRRGEREWMRVMASTYRNHVVLCGLGHLGFRVLEQLLAQGADVVAIENDPSCRFLQQAKDVGIPVLERDMKDDRTLEDAGVEHARALVIASNDDLANLEVALDARRMNPRIRVIMRLFDHQIASKFRDAFMVDQAFSASALAAPTVAAMALEEPVLASFRVGDATHVVAQVHLSERSSAAGRSVADVEENHEVRVLGLSRHGADLGVRPETVLSPGDHLTVSGPPSQLHRLAVTGNPRT